MRALFALFLALGLAACSGNRKESLNSGRDLGTATPDAGGAEPSAAAPLRNVKVGATGGEVASRSYRARVLLSYPAQPGLSRGEAHRVRLLKGEAQ